MDVSPKKLRLLRKRKTYLVATSELRRFDRVVQVPAGLPVCSNLEVILEMEESQPVELFMFDFLDSTAFLQEEELVVQLKKNFRGYLFGGFVVPPEPALIDRAYAAGLDLIQIPLTGGDSRQWAALNYARTIFPAWSVIAVLPVSSQSQPLLKTLLLRGIIPWIDLQEGSSEVSDTVLEAAFQELVHSWQQHKASLSPLYPLLELITPLVPPPRPHGLGGLIKRMDDARQRTGLDLRRLLRVRGVADSFESAEL